MSKLIGISGKMGSGKTTVLKFMEERMSIYNLRFSFPLYNLQDLIYNELGMKLEGAKDRKLLQLLGTDWGRDRDENIWVNAWKTAAVSHYRRENSTIVVDDMRFPNEFNVVQQMGGVTIGIYGTQRGSNVSNVGHSSESHIEDIVRMSDFQIDNRGSLDEMRSQVYFIVDKIMTPPNEVA